MSSRAALADAGLFDDYERHLEPAMRAGLHELIAGAWVTPALALAHYAACDALAAARPTQAALGRHTGERLSGTLLGTVARFARSSGATPTALIEQFPRFWSRGFEGGAITHVSRGPKDVEIFVSADPISRSPYFRNGLGGTCESVLVLVATKVYVRVKAYTESTGTISYLAQWV